MPRPSMGTFEILERSLTTQPIFFPSVRFDLGFFCLFCLSRECHIFCHIHSGLLRIKGWMGLITDYDITFIVFPDVSEEVREEKRDKKKEKDEEQKEDDSGE